VQTGSVVQPRNVSRAWLGGLEAGVAAFLFDELLAVRLNYTFLHSEDRSEDPTRRGRPLPGRPRHELSSHTSVGVRARAGRGVVEPRIAHTLDVISGSYLDPSGRFALPPRVIHGASLELHLHDRVHVSVEGRNLANRIQTTWTPPVAGATAIPTPIVDFVGYPLPGLSVWASVTIALDLRDAS
jgi:iron complex outermembrane receptor protein